MSHRVAEPAKARDPSPVGTAGAKRPLAPHTGDRGDALEPRPDQPVGAVFRIRRTRSILILTGLSLLACCLMFPPIAWGWLGYVSLVPWLVCVCTAERARPMYLISWLFGVGYFYINIRWMIPVTAPGYAAMCFYYSLFLPLVAWPIRHIYRRYHVSVALTAAIAWTAIEYLRSIGPLAFPWVLLGHTQYRLLPVIQISDLFGVYGVSFFVALINGWIVDLLIQPIRVWRADHLVRFPLGTAATAIVLVGTIGYGAYRLSAHADSAGPRIAVVQHDVPMYVDGEKASRLRQESIFRGYLHLTEQAAARKPDLIVLPETAMQGYINEEFLAATPEDLDKIQQRRYPPGTYPGYMAYVQRESRAVRDAFQTLCTKTGVPLLVGSLAMEWKPKDIPPRAEAYNSAFLLLPGKERPQARYDKNHLVIFGEYVPFRYTHHWLYAWLNSITPWGAMGIEYSLGFGEGFKTIIFDAASRGMRCRAGTLICYEEIMPYIGRAFCLGRDGQADEKNADLLLCISNDGWFLHSAELEQHLAAAVFRAVENRVSIARSVNTGASGFILPSGAIESRVELAKERIALLAPVESTLREMQRIIQEAGTAPGEDWTKPLAHLVQASLRPQLRSIGSEFEYLADGYPRSALTAQSTEPAAKERILRQLRELLADDLETVARWRRRPDTAPGFSVAETKLDSSLTLYTRWGDWFAQGAVILTGLMLVDWLLRRILQQVRTRAATEGPMP